MKGSNKIVHFTILFVALFYFGLLLQFRWNTEKAQKNIITSDALGYYDYLPRYFVNGHAEKNTFDPTFNVHYKGDTLNKYYIGTSIMESPFFAVAGFYYLVQGKEFTGYEPAFHHSISIGALIYFLLSLWMISRILYCLFGLDDRSIAFVILIFPLGSTLIYYTVIYGAFSHIYSFFCISWFFFYLSRLSKGELKKHEIILLFFSASMICVIRPVNALVILLIPFFFENYSHLKLKFNTLISQNKKILSATVLISFIPFLLQSLSWHEQTGDWVVWSYKNEGFNFSSPHFFDLLFSYNYGLFVYCPLLFISLSGLFFLFKENKWKFLWALIFLLSSWYILSSWWCWYYGEGLGIRAAVDLFLVFILLLVYLLKGISKNKVVQKIILSLILLCIPLNFIYSYQYYHRIINPNSMNAEKFWYVFLKTGDKYKNCFGGLTCIKPYAPDGFDTLLITKNDFNGHQQKYLNTVGIEFPYGEKILLDEKNCHHEVYWIKVTLKRKNISPDGGRDLLLDIHSTVHDTISQYYVSLRVKEMPVETTEEWLYSEYTLTCFNRYFCGNTVGIYFYNPKKEEVLIDDVRIEVYGVK